MHRYNEHFHHQSRYFKCQGVGSNYEREKVQGQLHFGQAPPLEVSKPAVRGADSPRLIRVRF